MSKVENSFMNKLTAFMEKNLVPLGSKIASQRHLSAIKDGLTLLIPLTIIGGFAVLLAVPPIPSTITESSNIFYAFLLGWQSWATTNFAILLIPYQLTIGILSIYVVCGISYRLAKHYGMDALNNMVSALLVFLCISGAYDLATGTLSIAKFGASYMFAAIIVSLTVIEINRFFIKKNIIIKLPDSVPPNVAGPFNALIPLVFNVILFMLVDLACIKFTGAGFTSLVFTVFQPLIQASSSLPSVIVIMVISLTFWFFGIHGDNLVGAIVTPIITSAIAANLAAYTAHQALPYIFAGYAYNVFGLWLVFNAFQIEMFLFCKSSRLKSLVKVSWLPSIFNINEPGVFGIPTVLNVYLLLPQIIASVLNFSVYYLLAQANVVGRFYMTVPFTTPGVLQAFLGTMDWRAAVLWVVLLVVDVLIALPFFKVYDSQILKEESLLS